MDDAGRRRSKSKASRRKSKVRKSIHRRDGAGAKRVVDAGGVEITYVVSAFNRPLMLPVALWSIARQTHRDFECIVADNAEDERIAKLHKIAVDQVNRFP